MHCSQKHFHCFMPVKHDYFMIANKTDKKTFESKVTRSLPQVNKFEEVGGQEWGTHSSGSSGRVGGTETWNLCGCQRQSSSLWLIFTGLGGHGPLPPPGSATAPRGSGRTGAGGHRAPTWTDSITDMTGDATFQQPRLRAVINARHWGEKGGQLATSWDKRL